MQLAFASSKICAPRYVGVEAWGASRFGDSGCLPRTSWGFKEEQSDASRLLCLCTALRERCRLKATSRTPTWLLPRYQTGLEACLCLIYRFAATSGVWLLRKEVQPRVPRGLKEKEALHSAH